MSTQTCVSELPTSERLTVPVRQLKPLVHEDNSDIPTRKISQPNDPLVSTPVNASFPIIPGYRILRQLGRGGMGVVYLAHQIALNRPVAIKMLATNGSFAEGEAFERFQREAETVAALKHPNIIQIFGLGTSMASGELPACPFIALEYADAGTLAIHTGKPIAPRIAAELVATLADAVQCAHDHGIIHRDLKPGNILMNVAAPLEVTASDPLSYLTPKITDFGVAKRMEATQTGVSPDSRTIDGSMIGTPEYMAPEQAHGRCDIGPAADVYALGVILYELLTGRVPLLGADTLDTLLLVRTQEPVRPSRLRSRLPRDLDTICTQCLQKDPIRRYTSAAALKDDLHAWLEGHPIAARPVSPVERTWKWTRRHPAIALLIMAVVALTIAGIGGVFWEWQRAEARAIAERASHIRADAAREKAETALYFGRVHVAQHELATGNQWDAIRLLNECRPVPGTTDRRSWEWYYLKTLSQSAKLSFQASAHWVWDVTFSPDGRWLATAAGSPYPHSDSTPGEVALWDATTGNLVQRFDGHTRAARRVSFSPNGRYLLSFGYDKTARLWELPSGRPVGRPLPVANEGHHWWQAFGDAGPGWFAPDSQSVLFRGPDQWLRLDISTGQVESVPQIQSVISVSRDLTTALLRESGEVFSVVDLKTMRKISRIDVPKGVDRAVISSDKKWVATSNNNLVEIYDVETGRRKGIYVGTLEWVESLEISPDGQFIAAAGGDRAIFVWSIEQEMLPAVFPGHTTEVRALSYSPDGRQLASCDQLGRVMVWDAKRSPRQQLINGHMHSSVVSALGFSAEGDQILTVRYEGSLQRFDSSGRRLWERSLEGFSTQVRFPRIDVQFNADATHVFGPCETDRNTFACWDTETCKQIRHFLGHRYPINGIAVSANGRWVASSAGTTGKDGAVNQETFVWEASTGQLMHKISCEPILGLALSSDGSKIAGASFNGDIILWDVATGREIWRQRGHGDEENIAARSVRVYAVAFSRDDARVATGDFRNGVVRLWDVATGDRHPTEMIARPSLTGITFTPDGKRVVAAGYDSEVRMWDVDSGALAIVLPPPSGQRRGDIAHTARPVFSVRNNRLALVDSRGFIGCWDGHVRPDQERQSTGDQSSTDRLIR